MRLNALFFLDYSRLMLDDHGITMSGLWAEVTTREKSEFENSKRLHVSFQCLRSIICTLQCSLFYFPKETDRHVR